MKYKGIFFNKVWKYFLYGVLVALPIYVTFLLIFIVITAIDSKVKSIIPADYYLGAYLPFNIPGIGILCAFLIFTIIGYFASGFIGKIFLNFGEKLMQKMPIVRNVYSTIKQIFEAVLKRDKGSFQEVVLIEYPRKGIWSLGFVTGSTRGEVQFDTQEEVLNVFIPTTPNPTSGFLLFVPRQDVKKMHMSVEDGIKMVISAGMIVPKYPKDKQNKET